MPGVTSSNRLQFSMNALLGIVTLICVVLAIPGGYVLLVVGIVWMLIGAALVMVLMIFRVQIYRFLSGLKNADEGKDSP